jgi:hypothetical protein
MLRRAQAARLLITDTTAPWPRLLLLRRKAATIGRSKHSFLVIGDLRVSNRHVLIKYRRGRYSIADLRSEAGTFVNGRRVRRRRLKHGDMIRFGGAASYRFIDPDAYLRLRARRRLIGASALALAALAWVVHFKRWDGGALSEANLEHALFFFEPTSQPIKEPGPQAVISVVPPAPVGSNPPAAVAPGGSRVTVSARLKAVSQSYVAHAPESEVNWLTRFNYYRTEAMLPAVAEDAQLSAAMKSHARYLMDNYLTEIQNGGVLGDAAYSEVPARRGYSPAAAAEASNSRLSWGCGGFSPANEIDHWMWNPFERLAMLDPRLSTAGFGDAVTGNCWVAAIRLPPPPGRAERFASAVEFPPNGASIPASWTGDSGIDPISSCPGYALPAGMPITLQLGNLYAVRLTAHSLTREGRPIEHCAFDAADYTNASQSLQEYGRWLLRKASAIVIVPRLPLEDGAQYRVAISANEQSYAWTFRVSGSSENPEGQQRAATVSRQTRSMHFTTEP